MLFRSFVSIIIWRYIFFFQTNKKDKLRDKENEERITYVDRDMLVVWCNFLLMKKKNLGKNSFILLSTVK